MHLDKLTGLMGAEISGIDLKNPISDSDASQLRAALDAHQMIVLRGQFLSIADQKRLNAVFGPLMQLPYVTPMADDPDVIAVLKEADEQNTGVFGGEWHSDFSFLENPPAGSVLNAVEIPDVGGDTVWSSQVAAYASLPADLKAIIDGRKAVHVGKPYGVKHAPPKESRSGASIQMVRGDPKADAETFHPAVVTGADGRKALFVNPIYTTRLDGMTVSESTPILEALYKHAARPDFSCRLKWQAGDVAVWDNRMSLHYATNDYDGVRRLLYRTTYAGTRPV
ncbi:TauD/TfdA family dioxygenase [Roseobacter sp. N2S]|uniref:TauD/TfdA dioxygenase family protein n=1 Tax=Roseobacter sp. N2S TaxID=2663844 RepID=UPI00285585D5|nr:TauD/TfdA family dioxygenase [Roseobacter sp. N2S]MDR6266443.1 taurine dioxygenase [Roseobacter sp. N2S]